MNVGELIKKVRKEKGMTQKQLAAKAEISFSMISKLESGERKNPTNDILTKIADALGVSKAELVDDKEKMLAEWDEKYNSTKLMANVRTLELLEKYELLNDLGKKKAKEYINDLAEQNKYTNKEGE